MEDVQTFGAPEKPSVPFQERPVALEPSASGPLPVEDLEQLGPSVEALSPRKASETAYYTARKLSNGDTGSLVETYMKVKSDMETTGKSPEVDILSEIIESEQSFGMKSAMKSILEDPDTGIDDKKRIVEQYLFERNSVESARENFSNELFDNRSEDTEQEIEDKAYDLSWFGQQEEYRQQIEVEKNREIAKGSLDIWENIGGFLELMIPFMDGIAVQTAKEAALGKDSWTDRAFNVVFAGQGKDKLREALERMPPPERLEAAKKILKAVGELPGADLKKMYLIEDMLGSYEGWQQGLDNLVGVLDTAFIGMPLYNAARGALKGTLRISASSPLGTARLADPVEAKQMEAFAILDRTGEVSKAMGVSREEIVAVDVLPKSSLDTVLADAAPDVVDLIEDIGQTAKGLLDETSTNGMNITKEAKEAADNLVRENLAAVEGPTLHLSRSVVLDTPLDAGERYAGLAVYGKTAERGYNNLLVMQKDMKALVAGGTDKGDLTLLAKDPATGQVIPHSEWLSKDKVKGTPNEFFIGRKFNHVYSRADAAALGADVVSPLGAFRNGGNLLDIVSRFDERISGMFLRAKDVGTAVETQLMDSVRKSLKGVGNAGKRKVFKVLSDGSDAGRVFSSTELKMAPYNLTDNEIKAYYGFRKVSDTLWAFTNRSYRKNLEGQGMLRVYNATTNDWWHAAPFKTPQQVAVKYAYDPATQTIKKLSNDEINEIYKKGGSIGKLEKELNVAGPRTTQIIIDNGDTKLQKLARDPLPYIEGYHQRTYKEHYFVSHIPKKVVVDGVAKSSRLIDRLPHGEVIQAYSSKTAAKEAAEKLRLESPGEEYVYRLAREFDVDPLVQDYRIYERNSRGTRRRGKHLAGAGDEALATIEDPIESLLRTARSVSNHVALDDVVGSMKRSWLLSYGHLTKNGQFPEAIADINKAVAKEGEYGRAVAIKELVDTVLNVPSFTEKYWQKFMFDMGEVFEKAGPLGRAGAEGLREAGKSTPIGFARKFPSHFFIALRPLRQLLVQSGQLLQYTLLEPKYLASGQAAREMSGIMFAMASKGRSWEKQGMALAAKAFGETPEEFAKVYNAFFAKSGLPSSVDANWFVEGVVNNLQQTATKGAVSKAISPVTGVYNKAVELGKRVGFDAGEFTNLAGSWLLAKRRWQRANPELAARWADKQNADVISADARKISYAMTQPGTFGYQKGLLSLPLQFLAVPHKALLSVTTNRYWTTADKWKIAGANLTLFGGYGLGLNKAFELIQDEIGAEIEPDLLQFIKGGTVDWAFNGALRAMTDEEGEDPTKILFSKSFSPFGEGPFPFQDVMANFMDGEWVKMALGPSYNIFHYQDGRIARTIQDIRAITQQRDLSLKDNVLMYSSAVANVASGYSDFAKYLYMSKYDKMVSTRGQELGIIPTRAETMSKLFGFQIAEEDNMYAMLRTTNDERKELEQVFDQYYESMLRIYRSTYKDDPDLARSLALEQQQLLEVFDQNQLNQLTQYIIKKDSQMLKTTQDSLVMTLAKLNGAEGDPRQLVINRILAAPMDEQVRMKLLNIFKIEVYGDGGE